MTTPPSIAVLRRSPRFAQPLPASAENADDSPPSPPFVDRRLNFNSAVEPVLRPRSEEQVARTTGPPRRVQLHPSLEPVDVPTSVDIHLQASYIPTRSQSDASPDHRITGEGSSQDRSPRVEDNTQPRERGQNDLTPPQRAPSGNGDRESPPGAAVIEEEGDRDGEVRASRADEQSTAFAFLSQMNVKQLRALLKEWRWKQSGNKGALVARAFLHLQILILSGKTMHEAMSSYRGTQRFESWISHKVDLDQRSPLYIPRARRESELFELLEVREVETYKRQKLSLERVRGGLGPFQERRTNTASHRGVSECHGPAAPASETHVFSISEFARLCIIMRDDEDAKAALSGTGQELNRSQLDAGFTRDSYWGVIESRFNDASLRLHLNMVGNLDDVDSTLQPPCHRSASFLKEKFFDGRRSFTTCVNNWSVSGQNDSGNFKQFAGSRNGALTAEGKRNMVMFVCTRKGTENEDTRFSNLCSRVIPFNRGCDEGAAAAGDSQALSSLGRGSRRNANNSSENAESAFQRSWRDMSAAFAEDAQAKADERRRRATSRKERAAKRKKTEAEEGSFRELKQRQWVVESLGELEDAMKSKGLQSTSYTEVYEQCAAIQRENLRQIFLRVSSQQLQLHQMRAPEGMGLPCEMPQSEEGPGGGLPSVSLELPTFVKHGIHQAEIEVSLYDIQLDNLSQFMPQERITEFTNLNNDELVEITVRYLGSEEKVKDFAELARCDHTANMGQDKIARMMVEIESLQNRQDETAGEVEAYKEQKRLSDKAKILSKYVPSLEAAAMKDELCNGFQCMEDIKISIETLRQQLASADSGPVNRRKQECRAAKETEREMKMASKRAHDAANKLVRTCIPSL